MKEMKPTTATYDLWPITTAAAEMPWQKIREIIYSADAAVVESLEAAGELVRSVLGTKFPWADQLARWLTAQGILWDELTDRRFALMVFIRDHKEASRSPRLVQHLTATLQRAYCITGHERQPLARFEIEHVIGECLREYVIKARGALCMSTGLNANGELIDVAKPATIAANLCAATQRASIRLGSPGVCWCGEHVTAEGEGFEPLPSESRSLDERTLRACVSAIDALTCEEMQNGGEPTAATGNATGERPGQPNPDDIPERAE